MHKHTPGPWYVTDNTEPFTDTAIATRTDLTQENYQDHEVLGYSEWIRVKPEDLKLMAAAPDLLEALQEIADSDRYEITCLKDDKPKYTYGKFAEIALQAIAKVTS